MLWAFFGFVVLVVVGVFFLSQLTVGEKAKDVHAGINFMNGKISSVQPSQSFQAVLASPELARQSGAFKIGADYQAFRVAQHLWAKVRSAAPGDSAREEVAGFYAQVQDQLKQDLLSNQFTAATLGDIVGESGLWDKLNQDPR